jgi:hypothetical protein
MGTLCKNCPMRGIQEKTGEHCTVAFANKYGNSCVTLDITEQTFKKELEEFSKEKKKEEKKKVNVTKSSTPRKQSSKKDKATDGKRSSNKKNDTCVQEVSEGQ